MAQHRIKIGDGHVLTFEGQQLVAVEHPKRGDRDCAWRQAEDLGERYLDHSPESVHLVDVPDWPAVMVSIGTLEEVVYSSKKWDGKLRYFHHTFGRDGRKRTEKPRLAVHPAGAPLFVIGGAAFVDERGIVG